MCTVAQKQQLPLKLCDSTLVILVISTSQKVKSASKISSFQILTTRTSCSNSIRYKDATSWDISRQLGKLCQVHAR